MPISLKRQVYDQCVLPTMTYGCQTWSLTKATTQKLRVAQRAMERKILGIKLADRVKCSEIRKRTQIQDIVDFVAKQKWKWAGHVARLKDNRWTLRVTEWQPRNGKRSRGRQARRWRDDIVKTKEIRGAETRETETNGDVMRRATSCSGWTEPRRT
ncbi:endonuclease-reverse transcriptase [Plakobranchus ocellatus]|uniref:Endonuclease-reverse transcriptase n=2 Tax=Plakobranchus ocellatus TaxID=259542 RepID=A0AAV4DIF3_9GAST|nr:endonuclease-reverse transcriptase [Plakobranchus ocellatus]